MGSSARVVDILGGGGKRQLLDLLRNKQCEVSGAGSKIVAWVRIWRWHLFVDSSLLVVEWMDISRERIGISR